DPDLSPEQVRALADERARLAGREAVEFGRWPDGTTYHDYYGEGWDAANSADTPSHSTPDHRPTSAEVAERLRVGGLRWGLDVRRSMTAYSEYARLAELAGVESYLPLPQAREHIADRLAEIETRLTDPDLDLDAAVGARREQHTLRELSDALDDRCRYEYLLDQHMAT
ncbi:hypothetical protein ACW9HQ_53725, partial [Nocardia gipuzkoensis]